MSLAMPVAAAPFAEAPAFQEPRVTRAPSFDGQFEHQVDGQFDDQFDRSFRAAGPAAAAPCVPSRTVAASGRLREESLPDSDRHLTVMMHLSPLAFIWIGPFALAIPLVMWLIRKEESTFADDHGRETVNFLISFIVLHFVLGITIIGLVLIPVLWVIACVNIVRGALAASRSEYFRCPMTIRFLT